jgi:hypothetical protein
MLVGCGINGLNPFGANDQNGSLGGLATLKIQLDTGGRPSIDPNEQPIITANIKLVDVLAQTQVTNWIPGSFSFVKFLPVQPGLVTITLFDVDNTYLTNTATATMTVRAGYNYTIYTTLGGAISMIETNVNSGLAYRYQMVYSESHNDTNIYAKGANLFSWNPATQITEQTNVNPAEGAYNLRLLRAISTTNWIGIGFTQTNGVKDNSLYSGGHLRFSVRTFNTNNTYKVGISYTNGATLTERTIDLNTIIGYACDGTWKTLSIPMSDFGTVDFTKIYTYFELASTSLQTNTNTVIDVDDVYWSRD